MSSLSSTASGLLHDFIDTIISTPIKSAFIFLTVYCLAKIINTLIIEPWTSPMHRLPGPPKIGRVFDFTNLRDVLESVSRTIYLVSQSTNEILSYSTTGSQKKQEEYTRLYGKNMRFQGLGYVC